VSHLKISSNEDLPFILQLHLEMDNLGYTRTVKISAKYWIINHTNLNLYYASGGTMLAGQSQQSSKNSLCYSDSTLLAFRVNDFKWTEEKIRPNYSVVVLTSTWNYNLSVTCKVGSGVVCVFTD